MENFDFFPFNNPILLNIFIAIIVAFLTAKLSLRMFYKQKLWEYKIKIYTDLIISLYNMKKYSSELFNSGINQTSLKNEKELSEKWKHGIDKIKEHIDIGSFIISAKTINTLSELLSNLSKIENSVISDQEYVEVIENCILKLKKSAKKDLKVNIFTEN